MGRFSKSVDSQTDEKSPQAGFLADRSAHAVRNHSGETALEFHQLPHQFPALAKSVLKRTGLSPAGCEYGRVECQASRMMKNLGMIDEWSDSGLGGMGIDV
jgi:hypothetical protein